MQYMAPGPELDRMGLRGNALMVLGTIQTPVEESLTIPRHIDFRLTIPPRSIPPVESPHLAGFLPSGTTLACATCGDLLFTAGIDGTLRWYDVATLRPVGSCVLPGVAYRLLFDQRRRLLIAALSASASLNMNLLGDRNGASGDISVFDLDALLKRGPGDGPPRPVHRFSRASHIWAMHLDASRDALYYLAETSAEIHLVRVDLLTFENPHVLRMRQGGIHALSASADGATLFGLSSGRLFAVDVASWQVEWSYLVGGNLHHLAAGPADHLYIVERRPGLFLLAFDVRSRRIVSREVLGIEGRAYLCRSSDARHLFLSNSAVTGGEILAIDLAGPDPRRPRLTGWNRGDREHLIRGGISLTDDGRFLVTGSGKVFRVGS